MNEKAGNMKVKLPVTIIMFVLGLFMIVPFLWMLSTSFQTPAEVFNEWLPSSLNWSNHIRVWTGSYDFVPYYLNSLKISIIGTAGAVFLSALAAYGFSRTSFKGRDGLFVIYLSMMMVPPQVLFVPKFIMFNWVGIYNTHLALILPAMFSIFGVFMLRQFFMGIPKEITESAFLDGAYYYKIFFRLILPLAKAKQSLRLLFLISPGNGMIMRMRLYFCRALSYIPFRLDCRILFLRTMWITTG